MCSIHFKSSDKNRGLLLISLCYLPAASRLTAVVLKAEGLPKVDLADSSGNKIAVKPS